MAKLLVMHPLIETHRAELLALARRREIVKFWSLPPIHLRALDQGGSQRFAPELDTEAAQATHGVMRCRVVCFWGGGGWLRGVVVRSSLRPGESHLQLTEPALIRHERPPSY